MDRIGELMALVDDLKHHAMVFARDLSAHSSRRLADTKGRVESAARALAGDALNCAGETPTQHAHRWATELAVSLAKKHYPEVPQFKPLPDLLGVITQIDNMTAGLCRALAGEAATPQEGQAPAATRGLAALPRGLDCPNAAEWYCQYPICSCHPTPPAPAPSPVVAAGVGEPEPRPSDDDLWDQTLKQRDNYHWWADRLTEAIATHFAIDIGEHSSANNPWLAAINAVENSPDKVPLYAPPTSAFEQSVEELVIPWLDVSSATAGMTPTERTLAAVKSMKEAAGATGVAAQPGWKLVPAEPMPEMQQAALESSRLLGNVEGCSGPALPLGFELYASRMV